MSLLNHNSILKAKLNKNIDIWDTIWRIRVTKYKIEPDMRKNLKF